MLTGPKRNAGPLASSIISFASRVSGSIVARLSAMLAAAKAPGVAHLLERAVRFAVLRRRAAEADVDLAHPRARARRDAYGDLPFRLGLVDAHVDFRREVAFGRRRLARLARRFLGEPAQLLGGHLRIVLPAHDGEALLQDLLQLARRLDLDAKAQALRRHGLDQQESEDRGGDAHAG